jgi:O-acetylserine/cysteine efflux transporter
MNNNRRLVFPALIAAGLLWGTTVPLSKLALGWLAPAWLALFRFGVAAAVLLVAAGWDKVRSVCRPAVLASGAAGYGGSVVLQNFGIVRTSVTHAALIVGASPVLIAIIAAVWHRKVARPVAWAGFALSLVGVGLVASGPGGGATLGGDGLVLASVLISAAFTVGQSRLLRGRDPVAVTGVQFLAAGFAVLPVAMATGAPAGVPGGSGGLTALLATAGLALGGTVAPFTLFAYAQSRVRPDVAGAFLNLEPLVGAMAGALVFRDPVGPMQAIGGVAVLAGIGLTSLQLRRAPHRAPVPVRDGDLPVSEVAAPAASALVPTAGSRTPWVAAPGRSPGRPAGHTGLRRSRGEPARVSHRPGHPAVARRPARTRSRRERPARPGRSRRVTPEPTPAPTAPPATLLMTGCHR